MPKNICIDLNVIIDVFLKRKGFEASLGVIQLGEQSDYRLYISAHMVTTLAYLLEDAKVPRVKIIKHIIWTMDTFNVIPTDEQLLRAATVSRLTDFEDAVVEQAAINATAKVIVTNNVRDFRASVTNAQTPKQYLGTLA